LCTFKFLPIIKVVQNLSCLQSKSGSVLELLIDYAQATYDKKYSVKQGDITMGAQDKAAQAEETIKNIIKRINSNSSKVKNWNNAIQFVFTDAEPYWIKISNGKVEQAEKANKKQEALVTLTCSVDVMEKIVDNQLGTVRALVTRKVKVGGSISAIRELRQAVGIN
jgi:putative sterol carrier protein